MFPPNRSVPLHCRSSAPSLINRLSIIQDDVKHLTCCIQPLRVAFSVDQLPHSPNLALGHTLYGDPSDCDDDIHTLLLRSLPLVAVSPILLVVPVRANRAVHATAAVLLGF